MSVKDMYDAELSVGDRVTFSLREGAYMEGTIVSLHDCEQPAVCFKIGMHSGLDWWRDRDLYKVSHHTVPSRFVRRMQVSK